MEEILYVQYIEIKFMCPRHGGALLFQNEIPYQLEASNHIPEVFAQSALWTF